MRLASLMCLMVFVLGYFVTATFGQACPNQWTTFADRPGTNDTVRAAAVAPDGTVVVVGDFTACGDVPLSRYVARFNPINGRWSAVGQVTNSSATLNAVAVLPNGDVIVGGAAFPVLGGGFSTLARFSVANGTWSALPSTGGIVYALAALPDGGAVVGGNFFNTPSQPGLNISILNSNMTTWTALGTGCNAQVLGCIVRSTGDIVAVGDFSSAGGSATGRVARFNRSTGQWNAIGAWTSGSVRSVAEMPGGDLVVGGGFGNAGGTFANNIARYAAASNSWESLSLGLNQQVTSVAYRPASNDIVAGGSFTTFLPGFPAAGLARYSLADQSWSSFGEPTSTVNTLVPLSGGRLFAGGTFTQANRIPADRCIVIDGNNSFSPATRSINAPVLCAAPAANGDLIVGGAFTHVGSNSVGRIARFNPATGIWTSLAGGFTTLASGSLATSSTVNCVAELSNGHIIAGGNFVETASGVTVNGLARFRPTTGQWEAFGFGVSGVNSILPESGGSFLISGSFDSAGGIFSRAVARFNGTTQAWEPVGTGMPPNAVIRDIIRLPNGDIFGVGRPAALYSYNAASDQWTAIGTISSTFPDEADTLLRLPDGRIMVGGLFSSIGGINASNVAIYNPSTNTWSQIPGVFNNTIRSLFLETDTTVLIGGQFTTPLAPSAGILRYNLATNTVQGISPGIVGTVQAITRTANVPGVIAAGSFLNLGDTAPAAFLAAVASGGTPAAITSQPSTRTSCPGVSVTFSVAATGSPAPTFQWQRNGVAIAGGSNPTALTANLQLPNVSLLDQGNYTCVVTNPCASVTSQVARLTVCPGDYDCSGGVDSDDVIGFFGDWDTGNIRADFNRDGGVDSDDVIGFFGRWDAGC